jgi:hypothetical protein
MIVNAFRVFFIRSAIRPTIRSMTEGIPGAAGAPPTVAVLPPR